MIHQQMQGQIAGWKIIMRDKEKEFQSLLPLTDREKVYKRFFELRGDAEAYQAYMKEMGEYVREKRLLIFEYPFVTHPELLTENDLYPDLSISRGANVNVVRHLRYTPVFVHSHSFFTMLYVMTGHCGHSAGGLDMPLEQGDAFFLPPYVKQTIEVFDDESVILNLHIRKDTFDDVFFNTLRYNNILSDFFLSSLYSKEPAQGILFHTGGDEEIRDTILEMYHEVELDDAYSWRLLNTMVPQLFAKLLRYYSEQAVFTGASAPKTDNVKLRILSYINNHYKTVTLEELADHFNYSVPHCSKLIREETGVGFVAFVRRIKMNHAVPLLLNTKTAIAEISSIVGYENPESFIRVFQKVYGTTPSAFRKKMKQV